MKFTTRPSSSSIMTCFPAEEARQVCCSAASAFITKLIYAIFVFIFTVVGATLGVVIGGFVGAKTKMGFMQGAAVGAIKGCFLSIKLFNISLIICTSDVLDSIQVPWNKGLSKDSMENIPKMRITEENIRDSFRNRSLCSVCLEEFLACETVDSVPQCQHMFHISCLQKWLTDHRSCPLCRTKF